MTVEQPTLHRQHSQVLQLCNFFIKHDKRQYITTTLPSAPPRWDNPWCYQIQNILANCQLLIVL